MTDTNFEKMRQSYLDAIADVLSAHRTITIAMHVTNSEWTKCFDLLREKKISITAAELPDRYYISASTIAICDAAVSLLQENGLQRKNPAFKIVERMLMWAIADASRNGVASRLAIERAKNTCDMYRELEQLMRIDTTFVSAVDVK